MTLKNCPFCGGKARFVEKLLGCEDRVRKITFSIECQDCKISLPQTYEFRCKLTEDGAIYTLIDERAEAADAWNNRAGEDNGL